MIDDLCLFMGPVADIQSCKYPLHPPSWACLHKTLLISNFISVDPERVQQNIRRHDYWYTAIFNNILNAAASYTWATLKSSLFDPAFFQWLQSNNTGAARDAILMVLLHSHVGPFETEPLWAEGTGKTCSANLRASR